LLYKDILGLNTGIKDVGKENVVETSPAENVKGKENKVEKGSQKRKDRKVLGDVTNQVVNDLI